MKQIKRFGILKTAKIVALLYFLFAILFAVPLGILAVINGQFEPFIIAAPFIMAIWAFVFVTIFCAIYNFLASKMGGIEIEIE